MQFAEDKTVGTSLDDAIIYGDQVLKLRDIALQVRPEMEQLIDRGGAQPPHFYVRYQKARYEVTRGVYESIAAEQRQQRRVEKSRAHNAKQAKRHPHHHAKWQAAATQEVMV